MSSLKKLLTPTLAALLLFSVSAWSLAAEAGKAAANEPAKDKAAQEQPKEQLKTAPTDPLVRVNGTTITRREVDRAVKVLLAQNQVNQPVAPEVMKQAQDAALEQLTAAELLYQEASKLEIKDLDKQVGERIAANRAKFPNDDELEKALKSVDMNMRDMEEFTRKDIIINNYIEKQFVAKTSVTEPEMRKFYDENKAKYFTKEENVRASHILIGTDDKMSADDRKKAKDKAEAILKRVKGGEDFAAVAKAESSCPSASQGGDLGVFTRGQMVAPFEKAAFALKPGETSDVVETQFGYHVIKLTEKHEAGADKFEDVKDKIAEYLKREKVQKSLADYITDLKKTAKIEKM